MFRCARSIFFSITTNQVHLELMFRFICGSLKMPHHFNFQKDKLHKTYLLKILFKEENYVSVVYKLADAEHALSDYVFLSDIFI